MVAEESAAIRFLLAVGLQMFNTEKYGLSDESPVVLNRRPAAALIDTIVSAVALA
jgi:hypothetical protein